MSPQLVRWCAHPYRHENCTKIGRAVSHPRGQRQVKKRLAGFVCDRYRRNIGGSKVSVKETDYFCSTCYNFEHNQMIKRQGSTNKINDRVYDNIIDSYITNQTLPNEENDVSDYQRAAANDDEEEEEEEEEEEDDTTDTATDDSIELQCSRSESIKLLNKVFSLLNIEPIHDWYVITIIVLVTFIFQFRRYTSMLRDKINTANVLLRTICEGIINSKKKITETCDESISFDINLSDCQHLLNGIKSLFFISNKEEQLRLLTMAPPQWGRKQIEYYFGCTEHQSKEAILLREKGGLLARPIFFNGNQPIKQVDIDHAIEYYQDDRISRQSSNKKDRIKVNGEEKFFRFMEISVGEAFQMFKQEYPNSEIGRSKFYSLRPKWVKIKNPLQSCLCVYHETYYLLLEVG